MELSICTWENEALRQLVHDCCQHELGQEKFKESVDACDLAAKAEWIDQDLILVSEGLGRFRMFQVEEQTQLKAYSYQY